VFTLPSSRLPAGRLFQLILCGCLLALPLAARADDAEPPSLSEKTSEGFQTLEPLINAKNWQAALDLLNGLSASAEPNSYDISVIDDTLWKIYWQYMDRPNDAIAPLEHVIALAHAHPEYLTPKDRVDRLQFAGQLYYIKALSVKNDAAGQRALFDKAMEYMKEWLAESPHPGSDQVYLYAVLLYQKAVVDPDHIDQAELSEARKETRLALRLDIHPRDSLYQLLTVEDQQSGDLPGAAQGLEWLIRLKPTSKEYWAELMAIYVNLASSSEKRPDLMREYYACAINTVERAQALGYLKTPKDNYNLVTMYNQVGQFGKATELLYQGLKTGGIESTLSNWLVLAYFYQQVNENLQAISVLKEAEALFPESGDIDRQIADIYYQDDKTQQVYEYCKKAVEKGNLKQQKPYSTWQLLAFSAYELGNYDEALTACEKAMSFPGAAKDLVAFHKGIQDAIKNRAATKAAIEEQSKQQ
jgi:tetratricopeptide (TPR) repeat protein